MATHDVLKGIVQNGNNLILYKGISHDHLRELIEIALVSGAKITITTKMSDSYIRELSLLGGNSVTFLDGLD